MTNRTGPPSRDGIERLFVVGCPRSGTTWVQLLLAEHPEIACANIETYLFSRYLGRLHESWRNERGAAEAGGPRNVLACFLGEDEFIALCRDFATAVFEKIRATRPGARVIADKTPNHAYPAAFILKVFPDARFLHVIRDPRDVFCSLRDAGASWGRRWAPTSPIAGARLWVRDVEAGLAVAALTDRYRELRYEALHADGPAELERLFRWLGVAADRARCEEYIERCRFARLRDRAENKRFFRRGIAGGWSSELARSEVRLIEHIAGPTMARTGYERSLPATPVPPLRLRVRTAIERWRGRLDRRLDSLLRRL